MDEMKLGWLWDEVRLDLVKMEVPRWEHLQLADSSDKVTGSGPSCSPKVPR
jgi:hypothetical protein